MPNLKSKVGTCKQCGAHYTIYFDDDGYCEMHYQVDGDVNDDAIEAFQLGRNDNQPTGSEEWN